MDPPTHKSRLKKNLFLAVCYVSTVLHGQLFVSSPFVWLCVCAAFIRKRLYGVQHLDRKRKSAFSPTRFNIVTDRQLCTQLLDCTQR